MTAEALKVEASKAEVASKEEELPETNITNIDHILLYPRTTVNAQGHERLSGVKEMKY